MTIRDRIKDFRRIRASELVPNPRNWRTHPRVQRDALNGVLSEIGYADALLARELPDGRLMLIDGHMRAATTPDQMVPVLVLDLNEEEGDKLLATLDPLTAMAETDNGKLDDLLKVVRTDNDNLQGLLDSLTGDGRFSQDPPKGTEIRPLNVQRPPRMSWVLIGIPTVRYGEISADVERIGAMHGVVCETTVNDG